MLLRGFEGQVVECDNKKELNMPLNKLKIDMALVFAAGVLWSTVGIGVRLIEAANVCKFCCTVRLAFRYFCC